MSQSYFKTLQLSADQIAEFEQIIDRFEQALFSGEQPRIDDYVQRDMPERAVLLAELVHSEMEYRARKNEVVSLETYLGQFPELAREMAVVRNLRDAVQHIAGNTISIGNTHVGSTHQVRGASEDAAAMLRRTGRYEPERLLGKGGMGAVWLAFDTLLKRRVAIKLPHFSHADGEVVQVRERFYREARAAASLRHPNICPVFDVGEVEGRCYLSMAYIEGRPLSRFIDAQHLQSQRNIVLTVRKIALGLQEAHAAGIVHRDLKPANILVDGRNEPVVMDFGLAAPLRGAGIASPDSDVRQTLEGTVLGTPLYMSPEQAAGNIEMTGPRSDLYSLGVIFYEMLTGRTPFSGRLIDLLPRIVSESPPPPSRFRADLDPRLEAICLRLLAKDPTERWESAQALVGELTAWLRGSEVQSAADGPAVEQTAGRGEHSQGRLRVFRRHWPIVVAAIAGSVVGAAVISFARHAAQTNSVASLPDHADYEASAPGSWISLLRETRRLTTSSPNLEPEAGLLFPGGPLAFGGLWRRDGLLRLRLAEGPRHACELRLRSQIPTAAVTRLQRYVALRWTDDGKIELIHAVPGLVEQTASVPAPANISGPFELVLSAVGDQIVGYVNGRKAVEHKSQESAMFGVPVVMSAGPLEIKRLDWYPLPPEPEAQKPRRLAESFLRGGSTVNLQLLDGTLKQVKRVEDLPEAEFSVVGLFLNEDYEVTEENLQLASGCQTLNSLGMTIGSDDTFQLAAVISGLSSVQVGRSTGLTSSGIVLLGGLARMQSIYLNDSASFGDAGVRALSNLSGISGVSGMTLASAGITDLGLESLGEMQNLTYLSLFGNRITGTGLAALEHLDRLTYLGLWNNPLTDDGLAQMPVMASMQSMDLGPAPLRGPGFAAFTRLPALSAMRLYGLNLPPEGWNHLPEHPSLTRVEFHGCSITDEVLPCFERFPKLTELHIDTAAVSDAGIEALGRLSRLKKLALWKTQVTEAGLKQLRTLLPDCSLIPEDPPPTASGGIGGGFF